MDNREAPPQARLRDRSASIPGAQRARHVGRPRSRRPWFDSRSCRWQQPIEDGGPEFCTHREVKPLAGTIAFDAQAWCPDCQYYKLRRTPKKRNYNEDYSY